MTGFNKQQALAAVDAWLAQGFVVRGIIEGVEKEAAPAEHGCTHESPMWNADGSGMCRTCGEQLRREDPGVSEKGSGAAPA